jgi:hypothetical protein
VYSNPASEYCPLLPRITLQSCHFAVEAASFIAITEDCLKSSIHAEAVIASSLKSPSGSAEPGDRAHSKLPNRRQFALDIVSATVSRVSTIVPAPKGRLSIAFGYTQCVKSRLLNCVPVALVLLCGGANLIGQNTLVSISVPEIQKRERIVGFEVHVRSGRIAQLRNMPIGWKVTVDNDPSWNTVVLGSVEVGAAALDPGFFYRFMVVNSEEYSGSGTALSLDGQVVVTSDFIAERTIRLSIKDFVTEPNGGSIGNENTRAGSPQPCSATPTELGRHAAHILLVKALSAEPTDGTYADEGYGQGEFETVKLVEVLKSTIRWKPGHVFRVHPFPGTLNEHDNFAPEHLAVGKRYYVIYTYFLDKEPDGNNDLIGLTRCGVLEDMPRVREQLLRYATAHAQHGITRTK